jgi:hypothetical protein
MEQSRMVTPYRVFKSDPAPVTFGANEVHFVPDGDEFLEVIVTSTTGVPRRSLTVADVEAIASGRTFETVNKNLSASDAVLAYSGGDLVSVTYANGIVKTLAYTDGDLTSVTLSGSTPAGIDLVKTFAYTDGDLTGVTYS